MIEDPNGADEEYYYHRDGLGNIVALSDADGNSVQTYDYSIYGLPAASDANHPNPYLFTGRRFDFETGLYYYRARMYHPNIGRFLQTDPIGYGDGMNWYAYCGNNPANCTDPSGNYRMIWDSSVNFDMKYHILNAFEKISYKIPFLIAEIDQLLWILDYRNVINDLLRSELNGLKSKLKQMKEEIDSEEESLVIAIGHADSNTRALIAHEYGEYKLPTLVYNTKYFGHHEGQDLPDHGPGLNTTMHELSHLQGTHDPKGVGAYLFTFDNAYEFEILGTGYVFESQVLDATAFQEGLRQDYGNHISMGYANINELLYYNYYDYFMEDLYKTYSYTPLDPSDSRIH